ncbi:uncharacterized protein [Drosophila virilis]|uniref:uncharacterized protein n=1 Tax=Drosophila virilis TaxID=7244 RepID=UPI001395DA68|nr:uncharacterized protein LOC6629539 [Drosophila virilis]XP_032293727.1 uncharacterized protein LOC26530489 [Drosophila virilis]
MLVYQVLLLPCALLALHLASARAQCPQSSVAVNAPCGQAAISCNVPYVPQNGACVLPFPTPSGCGSGQVCANGVVVHVFPSGFTNAQSVNSLCPNQPVQPQPAPCPNQPVIPYPPAQSQPAPCPNQPVTPYPPVPPETTNRPYQPPTTTTRETTTTWKTTTTRTTTTTPPPAPLRICPRGTVLINDNCRLVYCGSKVYSNGRCVEPRCPKGTYWTGQKCALPEPIELSPINLQRTIINENSKNTPDLVLNNVQHLTVNASLTLPTDYRDYEEDSEEEVEEAEEIQPPPSAPIKCCTVIAPRTCRCPADSNRWQCYNQRQQLCGDFCSAPKVAIRPASVSTWHVNDAQMLSMPPNWNAGCQMQSNCMQATERYDCSGCASGQMSSCSPYCYDYRCNSPTCAYYDQEQFCDSPQFADSVGCRPQDGWRR